jgi:SAM-dependent methyltransferase
MSMLDREMVPAYWNHNSAYHRWICDIARIHSGSVLDVGCGEGLLVERLAPLSSLVTGIDPDPGAVARARLRLSAFENVHIEQQGFLEYSSPPDSFDLVAFVASLHHMDAATALRRARLLVRHGGEIVVVGLAANKAPMDWVKSGLQLPIVRFSSWIHHENRDVEVLAARPNDSLAEIRAVADRELPGALIRRGLYYRYLLRWRRS